MHYTDLAIEIGPDRCGGHRVQLRSPFGQREGRLRWPHHGGAMIDQLRAIERLVQGDVGAGSPGSGDTRNRNRESAELAKRLGHELFVALFPDEVREALLFGLGRIQGSTEAGLRLRLLIDPSKPEVAALCALPWELLYKADTRDFFGRSLLTPIVRYLVGPRLGEPPSLNERLRILVAMACPAGVPAIDQARERERIEEAWGGNEFVEVDFLENATLVELRRTLRGKPRDVLHFIGHGSFTAGNGEGVLLFETRSGDPHRVPATALAESLKGCPQLRLVVLNACKSAQMPRRAGQDPYTSVGGALMLAGIPAVLAMQFPISDQAAIVFSDAFYTTLARGEPIDAAAAEGRLAIYQSDTESWKWITPVLYMAIADGKLFSSTQDSIEEGRAPSGDRRALLEPSIKKSQGVIFGGDVKVGSVKL